MFALILNDYITLPWLVQPGVYASCLYPQEAFTSASVAFILDYSDREKRGEERGAESTPDDGLDSMAVLYHKYGATLGFCAQKEVRVIVSGCHSNLGAAVISRSAPSLPPGHIIATPCRTVQRAKSTVACKLGLNSADIEQVERAFAFGDANHLFRETLEQIYISL